MIHPSNLFSMINEQYERNDSDNKKSESSKQKMNTRLDNSGIDTRMEITDRDERDYSTKRYEAPESAKRMDNRRLDYEPRPQNSFQTTMPTELLRAILQYSAQRRARQKPNYIDMVSPGDIMR